MVFIFLYCDPVFSSSEKCLGFRDWIRNHSSLPNEFEEGMVDLFVWILLIPYPFVTGTESAEGFAEFHEFASNNTMIYNPSHVQCFGVPLQIGKSVYFDEINEFSIGRAMY